MDRSLSVLLPVENAQSTLSAMVQEVLEVLPELTRHFEVVIIDDGSTDATIEVADELAKRYPQIRVLRHSRSLGRVAAIGTGFDHSAGEILFLKDEDCRLPIYEIRKLWRAMGQHEIALARPGTTSHAKRFRFKRVDSASRGGFQMFSRRVTRSIRESLTHQTRLLAKLAQQHRRWYEVEIHCQEPFRRTNATKGLASRLKRPNYLASLKNFALGE